MTTRPTGTVTFVFTDIEGSTQRWEHDRAAMCFAPARHKAILERAIAAYGGYVFHTAGDAYGAAFADAASALAASVDAQRALALERWDEVAPGFAPLRVRMGIHTGLTELKDGDYAGRPLNRTASERSRTSSMTDMVDMIGRRPIDGQCRAITSRGTSRIETLPPRRLLGRQQAAARTRPRPPLVRRLIVRSSPGANTRSRSSTTSPAASDPRRVTVSSSVSLGSAMSASRSVWRTLRPGGTRAVKPRAAMNTSSSESPQTGADTSDPTRTVRCCASNSILLSVASGANGRPLRHLRL